MYFRWFVKSHNERHHNNGEKPYACEFEGCTFRGPTNDDVAKHQVTHREERPFLCTFDPEKCNMDFKRKRTLAGHINAVHLNLRNFLCRKCGQAFRHHQSRNSHEKKKQCGKGLYPHQCNTCRKRFKTVKEYEEHQRLRACNTTPKIICEWCKKSYTSRPGYWRHKRKYCK